MNEIDSTKISVFAIIVIATIFLFAGGPNYCVYISDKIGEASYRMDIWKNKAIVDKARANQLHNLYKKKKK